MQERQGKFSEGSAHIEIEGLKKALKQLKEDGFELTIYTHDDDCKNGSCSTTK